MDEATWLICTDPAPMLTFLHDGGLASERKMQLFACACVRRIWDVLPDERSQQGVCVAELYADGRASVEELAGARTNAEQVFGGFESRAFTVLGGLRAAVAAVLTTQMLGRRAEATARLVQMVQAQRLGDERQAQLTEGKAQADLLRDLFHPFRNPAVTPSVLAWGDRTVVRLAQSAYENRTFDHLKVLADALEDAGGTDHDVLSHLRGPGPHILGCWCLDLLAGRE